MRQLKFKVWDKKYHRMFPAGTFTLESDGGKVNGFDRAFDGEHSEDENDFVVLEYTSLTDKHGKEICDGDIIQHNDNKMICAFYKPLGFVFVVINKNLGNFLKDFILMVNHNYRNHNDIYRIQKYCSIIGNIYENPPL